MYANLQETLGKIEDSENSRIVSTTTELHRSILQGHRKRTLFYMVSELSVGRSKESPESKSLYMTSSPVRRYGLPRLRVFAILLLPKESLDRTASTHLHGHRATYALVDNNLQI
ncbi:hypothetical protein VNI00_011207 [Paramarasmius palmivorus]|uniref:Uncharacterized protein n=1 Tax=Paramarasmius palmivorus TaxID=297713 RepID=A0AAW0CE22_9AGAR